MSEWCPKFQIIVGFENYILYKNNEGNEHDHNQDIIDDF